LIRRESFTSSAAKPNPDTNAKLEPGKPVLIIGFDAEWVAETLDTTDDEDVVENPDPDGNADTRLAPDEIPHNRILSYQYACRYNGQEWSGIVYTRAGARIRYPQKSEEISKYPERITFGWVLAAASAHGIHDKHLTRWPNHVIAAAHWTRADLCAMVDYATIKRQFDNVRNTYVTLAKPYRVRTCIAGHVHVFNVSLIDTQLLTPGSTKSLAALGDLYQFPKLDLGHKVISIVDGGTKRIPYIEHMDWLLGDDPALYEQYAIRDAEISASHVDEMLRFVKDELGLGYQWPPATLGSLAVKYLVQQWQNLSIDIGTVLDGHVEKVKRYCPRRRHYVTTQERKHSAGFEIYRDLAAKCFHGGRNECFYYGPTIYSGVNDNSVFREYDLISAYAIAMASIRTPNWAGMYTCNDVAEFAPGVLGVAHVRFSFPIGTRLPSLPVLALNDHGLIYPLAGEVFVTASEIAVARRQGAEIEVLSGVIVPCRNDSCWPFMLVIAELYLQREQYPKGSLPNEMLKQLANSLYGKLG
jgi:hypothetical protein